MAPIRPTTTRRSARSGSPVSRPRLRPSRATAVGPWATPRRVQWSAATPTASTRRATSSDSSRRRRSRDRRGRIRMLIRVSDGDHKSSDAVLDRDPAVTGRITADADTGLRSNPPCRIRALYLACAAATYGEPVGIGRRRSGCMQHVDLAQPASQLRDQQMAISAGIPTPILYQQLGTI